MKTKDLEALGRSSSSSLFVQIKIHDRELNQASSKPDPVETIHSKE